MNKEKNSKFSMWDIVKAISVMFGMVAALYAGISFIDNRIENKINNPGYIKKIVSSVRPAIIFDSKGSIVNDLGGMEYVDKIEVIPHDGNAPIPKKVILTPKMYLATPPILTSIDSAQYLISAKRGKNIDWEYEFEIRGSNTGTDYLRFRLEIIK